MKRTLATVVAFLTIVVSKAAIAAPIHGLDLPSRIPDDYIVVLRDGQPAGAQADAVVPSGSIKTRPKQCSSTRQS